MTILKAFLLGIWDMVEIVLLNVIPIVLMLVELNGNKKYIDGTVTFYVDVWIKYLAITMACYALIISAFNIVGSIIDKARRRSKEMV